MCVCVSRCAQTCIPTNAKTENRKKARCVSGNTQTKQRGKQHYTTTTCIQYNYIQQTNKENNRLCIQDNYIRGVGA